MKTLWLLRHAKSSRDDAGLEDFDRPLAPRGRKAAARMGAWMRQNGIRPGLVLCSAARRTRATWELVAPELEAGIPAKLLRGLYHAPPSRLLAAIRRAPDAAGSILLVGHNPGLEHLAAKLAGPDSDPAALERMRRKFPTAALAAFTLPVPSWQAVGEDCGRLTLFLRPRDLDAPLARRNQGGGQKGLRRR